MSEKVGIPVADAVPRSHGIGHARAIRVDSHGKNRNLESWHWDVVFDAINDLICLLDRDGTILECNAGMSRLLDLPNEQIVGRKCHEVMHGADTFCEGCPHCEMLRSRKRESFELTRDGKCYRVTTDPVFGDDGEILGAVHIVRDITQYKQLALVSEERLRFERLLADLSASLANLPSEQLDAKIDGSLKALVEFLGNDRSALVEFAEGTGSTLVTHSCAIAGCAAFPVGPLAEDRLPWLIEQFRSGKSVFMRCLPRICRRKRNRNDVFALHKAFSPTSPFH